MSTMINGKRKVTVMMEKFSVPDGVQNHPFMGVKLGEVSTDEKQVRPRWTELRLFRLATDAQVQVMKDGGDPGFPGGVYLVHSMGRSLVFHKDAGGCGKGTRTEAGKMSQEMEACEECWPGDYDPVMTAETLVRAELDRGFAVICETAADVGIALEEMTRKIRPGGGRITKKMSGPAAGLLVNAAPNDPDIAALLGQDVPLTPLA